VFRKKTHGEVAADEFQEGLAHLGVAVSEAGRAAAERLAPRVEAAREAAAPRLDAARDAMAPKVAAAMAAAAPAVATARENLATARENLAPRVEAAQKALKEDVVPRLEAAQEAAVAYATPRMAAARQSLVEGLEAAVTELEARREEYAAAAKAGTKKARKKAEKKRREFEHKADKKRRELTKKAAKTTKKVKRKAGLEPEPRRWPWVLLVLAVGGVVVALRGRKNEEWTPAPTGDGPVPSYREDPVPSSPSNAGKTVSDAENAVGDATPPDTDLGMQPPQMAEGEAENADTPGAGTGGPENPDRPTA
jgi:hypothetical protein